MVVRVKFSRVEPTRKQRGKNLSSASRDPASRGVLVTGDSLAEGYAVAFRGVAIVRAITRDPLIFRLDRDVGNRTHRTRALRLLQRRLRRIAALGRLHCVGSWGSTATVGFGAARLWAGSTTPILLAV